MIEKTSCDIIDIVNTIIELSKTDPGQAEEFSRKVIESEIARMAGDDSEILIKLQQMQWKIDGELRKFKDPVARHNKMQELFWCGVNEFVTTLKNQ